MAYEKLYKKAGEMVEQLTTVAEIRAFLEIDDSVSGITAGDIANWNAAFGWGNHAGAGYLTSETDPVYTASSWFGTTNNAGNWNTAYGWGNHASAGYLTALPSHTHPLSDITQSGATTNQVPQWNGSAWVPVTISTSNIYTADGTLTGNRAVTLDTYTFSIKKATDTFFHVFNNGNVLLSTGTPSDGGYKLDVQGTVKITGLVSQGPTTGAKQYWYDGGAGIRHGVGINANNTQFFHSSTASFTFNLGGDLQSVGTNELLRINATAIYAKVPVDISATYITGGVTTGDKVRLYGGIGTARWGFGIQPNTFVQYMDGALPATDKYVWRTTGSGSDPSTGGTDIMKLFVQGNLQLLNTTNGILQAAGSANNYMSGTLSVGATTSNASSIVEIVSTTKGFLPPRMTATQAEAIASPAEGLLLYANNGAGSTITSKGWWGYDGAAWVKLN
jgi:hypothetical protein